ncbi:Uncharacterised protein [Kocuria rosea]|nr:Uncharacterised protein [Kocuria rosea]
MPTQLHRCIGIGVTPEQGPADHFRGMRVDATLPGDVREFNIGGIGEHWFQERLSEEPAGFL